jgi:acyl-CoA synthetase (AMP-forming)/AMP-acid ligase II
MPNPPTFNWQSTVAIDGGRSTWAELAAAFVAPDTRRVAVVATSLFEAWSAFAWAAREQCDFLLVDTARANDELIARLAEDGYTVWRNASVIAAPLTSSTTENGRVTVLTSGTTGAPKLIAHTFSSLATMQGLTDLPARTWMVPYAVGTYAWYQLAMMGLSVSHQALVAVNGEDATSWVKDAKVAGVDAISATPTFWRRALLMIDESELRLLDLRQVTLGGEPVDQSILDRLAAVFPHARISHIYASSEAGALMAVHDGRAGFPKEWLNRDQEGRVQLAIRDDMLQVRSPHRASSVGDDWFATNDRVEVVGDRVFILGRNDTGFINVGGTKVDASHVAQVLLNHPSVLWARVKGRKAPIIGQMPVAEVVLTQPGVTSQQIVQWAGDKLPEAAVPRIVRILDDIPTTSALKSEVS